MKKILITLFAAGLMASFYSMDLSARQCCGGGMRASMNYDRATVETLKGTITDIGTFRRGGIHISLKTAKEMIDVHLGPDDFINDKVRLAKGDEVTIVGSRIKWDGKDAIIAKIIDKGGVKAVLSKDDGTPLLAGHGHRRNK